MSTTVGISSQEESRSVPDVAELAVANPAARSSFAQFLRSAVLFVLVGAVLYLAVYGAAEALNYNYAKRNRFFNIKTAPLQAYDYVFLGASHAAAMDYEDMTAQLEQMTGANILNLSNVGTGVVVNRLVMDYFLKSHQTENVVYFIDSFAFNSPQWNEERLQDTALFNRAPFDLALAQSLLLDPAGRSVALDYIVGFSKINNPDRFKTDITDDEATRFSKVYRPIKQIDQQRLEYLYPNAVDKAARDHYLAEFEEFIQTLKANKIQVIVVKPPVPERWYQVLPQEAEFDAALRAILDRNGVVLYDYSLVDNDEKFFYNTDHLNRDGVLNFFQNHLKDLIKPGGTQTGAWLGTALQRQQKEQ